MKQTLKDWTERLNNRPPRSWRWEFTPQGDARFFVDHSEVSIEIAREVFLAIESTWVER